MQNSNKIIDGSAYAKQYLSQLADKVRAIKESLNLTPTLAVVLVGDNPASLVYVHNKIKRAQEIGIKVLFNHLPHDVSQEELTAKISDFSADSVVNGILLQLPLPPHLDANTALNMIDPNKDVDGFHHINVGKLNTGQQCLEPGTPTGVMLLIKHVLGTDLSGLKAVILGRSQIVGKPMASMLLRENCTVTVMHSHSRDLVAESQTADILISAVGKPHMVKANWIKPGALVIDVGIVRVDDVLYGDVDFEDILPIVGHITPVPGGVGPMTVACMLANTIKAVYIQFKIEKEIDDWSNDKRVMDNPE
ncbi:MAG: bifunctional 5,10-methylenetetrahydrofolate dehydrogenase/5,10-methenyltetrahydrofolate cyclohydrolase [Proteobacteria bacterium]|nr:bifunctional 5,10-methylenetetrahydrofolate dehydrogenase/5,10-methenyltetrahydrofolate cyclohydrolase [Pseudomonadota bacterium]